MSAVKPPKRPLKLSTPSTPVIKAPKINISKARCRPLISERESLIFTVYCVGDGGAG